MSETLLRVVFVAAAYCLYLSAAPTLPFLPLRWSVALHDADGIEKGDLWHGGRVVRFQPRGPVMSVVSLDPTFDFHASVDPNTRWVELEETLR